MQEVPQDTCAYWDTLTRAIRKRHNKPMGKDDYHYENETRCCDYCSKPVSDARDDFWQIDGNTICDECRDNCPHHKDDRDGARCLQCGKNIGGFLIEEAQARLEE